MYGAECVAQADDSTVCECTDSCPEKSDLVCASDGNTYKNECEVKKQSCLKKKPLVVARKGSCGKLKTQKVKLHFEVAFNPGRLFS